MLISFPVVIVAVFTSFILSENQPFGIQIVFIVAQTGFVFLFVFCDTRGFKGFSLGDRGVRQKLPSLLWIHLAFLAIVFAGVTAALWVQPRLPVFWTLKRNVNGHGKFSNSSYFDNVSLLALLAVIFTQAVISRRILQRAITDDERAGEASTGS